ncbi:MAG: nuclear transport factor 2 family protein [Actinomycetota bacterium]
MHRGHEGYLRVWEAVIEAMEDFKLETEEVIDFGDRLLTAGHYTGHGTSSGVPVNQPFVSGRHLAAWVGDTAGGLD